MGWLGMSPDHQLNIPGETSPPGVGVSEGWARGRRTRSAGVEEDGRCGDEQLRGEGPAKGRLSWALSHSPALHGSLQEPPFPRGLARRSQWEREAGFKSQFLCPLTFDLEQSNQ